MSQVEGSRVNRRLSLSEIEKKVCDIASEHLGIPRDQVHPSSRLIQDLNCDSLDMVEIFMEWQDTFNVDIDDSSPHPIYKSVFTRPEVRLADIAELIYLRQDIPAVVHSGWKARRTPLPELPWNTFTQLSGRWDPAATPNGKLFEPIPKAKAPPHYRRRSDGMRCVLLPAAEVEIGSPADVGFADEGPRHVVAVDSFLIDAEPVSTTAYCRFLNSIGPTPQQLADWFVLTPDDDRTVHQLIEYAGDEWRPIPGTEKWPMILVSWYGAHAYARWANGCDGNDYDDTAPCYLPSEVQWEYAARGATFRTYPWGEATPTDELLRFGRHRRGQTYEAATLQLAGVNDLLGMSPFHLHHMAGNVWQWCADWYDAAFYGRTDATKSNACNDRATGIRSERGGSWIGPAGLCRSSHRRGRIPTARGRCLGFRCISRADAV